MVYHYQGKGCAQKACAPKPVETQSVKMVSMTNTVSLCINGTTHKRGLEKCMANANFWFPYFRPMTEKVHVPNTSRVWYDMLYNDTFQSQDPALV